MIFRMFVFLALLAQAGVAWSAPITFNTALPVAESEFVAREQLVVNQSGKDPGNLVRDRTAWAAISVLGYGVTGDLALFGIVPFVNKDLKLTTGNGRLTRQADGPGDMKIFGRYTIYKNNFSGGNFRVAPFTGIKLPTGDSKRRDGTGLLPPVVQPGSGSWDPFGGIVMTYQTLNFQIDAGASYQANSTANGFAFGDVSRLDSSFQYRLWPRKLGSGVPGFLYGIMEVNLIHQNNNRTHGITDPNSGGTRLFLAPGLQYVTRRWIIESSVQLPVVQDLNGTGLKNDFIVRAGFRVNF